MRTTRDHTEERSVLEDMFAAHRPLHVRYAAGELVTQIGSYAAGVYFVQEGLVQESSPVCPVDKEESAVVEVLGPGELLGLEPLLPWGQELYVSSSRALTETCLSFIERSALATACENDQALDRQIQGYLVGRLYRARDAASLRFAPVTERLRFLLLRLAEACAPAAESVVLPAEIDRRAIAGILGVAASRVTRGLRALNVCEDSACLVVDVVAIGRDLRPFFLPYYRVSSMIER